MRVGRAVCDWCGIAVLWDRDLYTKEVAMELHKDRHWGNAIFESMIALKHEEYKERHDTR